VLIISRSQLHCTASGIITPIGGRPVHSKTFLCTQFHTVCLSCIYANSLAGRRMCSIRAARQQVLPDEQKIFEICRIQEGLNSNMNLKSAFCWLTLHNLLRKFWLLRMTVSFVPVSHPHCSYSLSLVSTAPPHFSYIFSLFVISCRFLTLYLSYIHLLHSIPSFFFHS